MAQNDINIRVQVDTTQANQSTENYKKRLKELKDEMTALQIETDGLTKASAEQKQRFNELSQEAGKIADAMGDTAQRVKNLSDDFSGMTATLQGIGAAVGGITAVSGAMSLFGVENEKVSETIKKLTSLMSILQGVQTLEKALNKDSALMTMLRTKAQKSLNTELGKTTVAEGTATTATATFTAAEGAATAGAGTLTVAIKAVGTAIKSIPVVGWVLAAISALTALIALIYEANQAEADGNKAREKHLQQLRDMIDLQARLSSATSLMLMDLSAYSDIISDISKKGSTEWVEAVEAVAKQTGLSAKYIESQNGNINEIVNNYSELTAEQERFNSYMQQQQALLNERIEAEKKGEQLSADYTDNLKAVSEKILESKDKINNLQRVYNGYLAEDKKYNESIANAQKKREQAKETANNREKEAIKELADLEKFIADQTKKFNNETLSGRLANIDAEEKALTDMYDNALDSAIKYYGEESEQVKQLTALRTQALAELDKAREKAQTDELRQAEDQQNKIDEAKLKTRLNNLDKESKEYFSVKKRLDEQEQLNETIELKRRYEDGLISETEFQTQLDLIRSEHANIRAELDKELADKEIEQAERVAAEYERIEAEKQALREAKFQAATNLVNAYNDVVTAQMEAELEAAEGNEKEQKAIRKRYARSQFLGQIASIGISTAKAIMETWAAYAEIPFVGTALAGVQSALITGLGIAQTIKARNEMENAMKAEKGGILNGRSHANGGIKTDIGLELEGGEAIINKRSTAAFAPILSEINSYNGYGVPLVKSATLNNVSGGGISESVIQKIVSATVAGITSIPVVVSEHWISEAQRNVGITMERARI